jgi:hypothetical protein
MMTMLEQLPEGNVRVVPAWLWALEPMGGLLRCQGIRAEKD